MTSLWCALLVPLAFALDRAIGDPRSWHHPVQAMGGAIALLRRPAEAWAGDDPCRLRLAGGLITAALVGGSGALGWLLERLALTVPLAGVPLLLLGLASALAGRSLEQAVAAVVAALPDLPRARQRLAWIVGRDVEGLDEAGILRAAAETAAENAVDGLFAPLFWMVLGAALWCRWPALPGPLALAWGFKAASTLDSMLGYRRGRLRWLGTAGARLDDVLVWLPCRLVVLGLPLVADWRRPAWRLWQAALRDGAPDPSPNAGRSQAAFAHSARVRLGGSNRYGGRVVDKPLLAADEPAADAAAVSRILQLSRRLALLWVGLGLAAVVAMAAADGDAG